MSGNWWESPQRIEYHWNIGKNCVKNDRQKWNCVVYMSDTILHVCVTWKPTMVRNFVERKRNQTNRRIQCDERTMQSMCFQSNYSILVNYLFAIAWPSIHPFGPDNASNDRRITTSIFFIAIHNLNTHWLIFPFIALVMHIFLLTHTFCVSRDENEKKNWKLIFFCLFVSCRP